GWHVRRRTTLNLRTQALNTLRKQGKGARLSASVMPPFPHSTSPLQPAREAQRHSSVCVPCVTAPPARGAAVTSVVSANSCSVAPAFLAFFVWISMQYGHCVVSATATAISSLYLSGMAPPLKAASSNATKPLKASGANSPSFLSLVRFF